MLCGVEGHVFTVRPCRGLGRVELLGVQLQHVLTDQHLLRSCNATDEVARKAFAWHSGDVSVHPFGDFHLSKGTSVLGRDAFEARVVGPVWRTGTGLTRLLRAHQN